MKKNSSKIAHQDKTAQDVQDEIFQRMSASKKLKLASDLSMLCLKLNQLGKDYEPSKALNKNRRNSG